MYLINIRLNAWIQALARRSNLSHSSQNVSGDTPFLHSSYHISAWLSQAMIHYANTENFALEHAAMILQ